MRHRKRARNAKIASHDGSRAKLAEVNAALRAKLGLPPTPTPPEPTHEATRQDPTDNG